MSSYPQAKAQQSWLKTFQPLQIFSDNLCCRMEKKRPMYLTLSHLRHTESCLNIKGFLPPLERVCQLKKNREGRARVWCGTALLQCGSSLRAWCWCTSTWSGASFSHAQVSARDWSKKVTMGTLSPASVLLSVFPPTFSTLVMEYHTPDSKKARETEEPQQNAHHPPTLPTSVRGGEVQCHSAASTIWVNSDHNTHIHTDTHMQQFLEVRAAEGEEREWGNTRPSFYSLWFQTKMHS